jgi:hypothetical protein
MNVTQSIQSFLFLFISYSCTLVFHLDCKNEKRVWRDDFDELLISFYNKSATYTDMYVDQIYFIIFFSLYIAELEKIYLNSFKVLFSVSKTIKIIL